jgi:hypothetical protein
MVIDLFVVGEDKSYLCEVFVKNKLKIMEAYGCSVGKEPPSVRVWRRFPLEDCC